MKWALPGLSCLLCPCSPGAPAACCPRPWKAGSPSACSLDWRPPSRSSEVGSAQVPGSTCPCPAGMAVSSGGWGGQEVVKAAEQVTCSVSPRVTPRSPTPASAGPSPPPLLGIHPGAQASAFLPGRGAAGTVLLQTSNWETRELVEGRVCSQDPGLCPRVGSEGAPETRRPDFNFLLSSRLPNPGSFFVVVILVFALGLEYILLIDHCLPSTDIF